MSSPNPPLLSRLGDLYWRGGNKDCGSQTGWRMPGKPDCCTYEPMGTAAALTRPAQVPARQGHSTENGKWIWVPPLTKSYLQLIPTGKGIIHFIRWQRLFHACGRLTLWAQKAHLSLASQRPLLTLSTNQQSGPKTEHCSAPPQPDKLG